MKTKFIGIAGSSASGKTTFAKQLQIELGGKDCEVISLDSYYKSQDHLSMSEREKTNYDHPDSFEISLLIDTLTKLREKNSAQIPIYDYSKHTRSVDVYSVEPKRVVLVEGVLTLYFKELREFMDYTIYIDTPLDLCLERRSLRDVKERGRTKESVLNQWNATVLPMYLQYCKPYAMYSDYTFSGEGEFAQDILQIKDILNSI